MLYWLLIIRSVYWLTVCRELIQTGGQVNTSLRRLYVEVRQVKVCTACSMMIRKLYQAYETTLSR